MNQQDLVNLGIRLLRIENIEEAKNIGEELIKNSMLIPVERVTPIAPKTIAIPIPKVKAPTKKYIDRDVRKKEIVRIIGNNEKKMNRAQIARVCQCKKQTINPLLKELEDEGRIKSWQKATKGPHCGKYYFIPKKPSRKRNIVYTNESKEEVYENPNVAIARGDF